MTAFGAVPAGRMAPRSGVRPGDRLYVTGTVGDAAIGLGIRLGRGPDIAKADKEFLLDRYLLPQPRVALAKVIAMRANGCMDVSDGFVGDLTKMLAVSGVTARVLIYRLPLSPSARAAIAAKPDLFAVAATGGDDYELLAAVAPDAAPRLRGGGRGGRRPGRLRRRGGRGLRSAAASSGPTGRGSTFPRGSYSHF